MNRVGHLMNCFIFVKIEEKDNECNIHQSLELIILLNRIGHNVKETSEKWYFLEVDLCHKTFNIHSKI